MDKNIIWINRGIIISLIYIILKIYNKLKDKYLIIKQKYIREFLQFLFPKLNFISNKKNRYSNESDSDDDHKDYYDFFIRSTPSKADNNYIVIDYLSNYNNIIPTDELWLVPYYDDNDPLIMYLYKHDSKDTKYLKTVEQYQIINDFSHNKRNNYKSDIHPDIKNWDLFFESSTLARYNRNGFVQKSINLSQDPPKKLLDMINNYLNNKLFLNNSEEMFYTKPNKEISNIYQQPLIFIPEINPIIPKINDSFVKNELVDSKTIKILPSTTGTTSTSSTTGTTGTTGTTESSNTIKNISSILGSAISSALGYGIHSIPSIISSLGTNTANIIESAAEHNIANTAATIATNAFDKFTTANIVDLSSAASTAATTATTTAINTGLGTTASLVTAAGLGAATGYAAGLKMGSKQQTNIEPLLDNMNEKILNIIEIFNKNI